MALEVTLRTDVNAGQFKEEILTRMPGFFVLRTANERIVLLVKRRDVHPEVLRPARRRIRRAPGAWLYEALKFLYPQKKFEAVFEPTIVDFWREYSACIKAGRSYQAIWFRIRLPWDLAKAMGLDAVFASVSAIKSRLG